MQVGGPEATALVLRATDGAEICSESVEPDIENMRLLAGNGNAPADRSARDAEIAQATFDEGEDFIAARFGLNEVGILSVEIEQDVLKRRELEEIVVFGDGLGRASALGARLAG